MKRMCVLAMLATMISLALAGCGGGGFNEANLRDALPDSITTCYFNDELKTQNVSNIEVVKADVSDDEQYVRCEITLKDDDLERCVYADLNLKKYEKGGWQVDYWQPYEKDHVISVKDPDGSAVDAYMAGLGYSSLQATGEGSVEYADFATYTKSYSVNESYRYATFAGDVVYTMELTEYGASNEGPARYSWEGQYARSPKVDYTGLSCDWDISTQWTGVEINPKQDPPYRFEVSLNSITEGENLEGSGKLQFPAYDGFTPLGRYGDYDFVSARFSTEGASPSDATAVLSLSFVYGPAVVLRFTPDDVSATQDTINGELAFDVTGTGASDSGSGSDSSSSTSSSDYSQESTSSSAENSESTSTSSTASKSQKQLVFEPDQTDADGYVLPMSATRLYTRDEVEGLSTWGLAIARNEIPARHGLKFDIDEIADYFATKDWYEGTLTRKEFRSIAKILNTTEEANVAMILEIEKERKSPWLPPE